MRIVIENTTNQAVLLPEQLRLGDGSLIVSVTFEETLLPPPERSSTVELRTTALQPGESHTYSVALDDIDGYVFATRGTFRIRILMAGGFPVSGPDRELTLTVY